MATATLIPVSEYLATSYRPDCDYIDGQVKERNMGEQPHASLQAFFGAMFYNNRKAWSVRALPEQRVQVSPTRYRIPDICILHSSHSNEPIITTAPLLCIEILSKGDSLYEIEDRIDDYTTLGVEHIWVIDPWKRRGYVASPAGLLQPPSGELTIPGTPIRVSLAEAFAELDEAPTDL